MKTFRKTFLEHQAQRMRDAVKDDPEVVDVDLLVKGGLRAIIAYAKDEASVDEAVSGWIFAAGLKRAKDAGAQPPKNPLLN